MSVELDREVVAVRTNQRLAPAHLLGARALEGRHESRRLRSPRRSPLRYVTWTLRCRARQRRIHARNLGLQRRDRPPAPVDQLHADRGELLVPRRETVERDARTCSR